MIVHHIISRRIAILLAVLLAAGISLFAQNSTSSPLSIFGIGEIESRDFGSTTGFGNAGIGMKSVNFLNRRNPAGLSGIDTLVFIFDISTAVKSSVFSTSAMDKQAVDFNFKNLSAGFRISKRWTTGVGLSPYTNVGYSISQMQQVEGTPETFNTVFSGEGGVNKVYWGNAVEVVRGLSLGLTASYFFGTITHNETARSILITETMTANKLYLDFGAQYSLPIEKHTLLTVGGVYGYKSNFDLYRRRTVAYYNVLGKDEALADKRMYLPESFGVGFSVWRHKKDHEWLFAADYYRQNWSVNSDRLRGLVFSDSQTYNAGLQFVPNSRRPSNYLQVIRYQAGVSYSESYLSINGYPVKDYSVSFGLGLPFSRTRSYVNVAVNAGQSGTGHRGGITENYVLFSVNLSLIELWFAKQKFE
ncbi:MAG: hypothetical protein LBR08_05615 [Bacteroidales bacterium]|nr:hypothetical protein [Bacteroidales bacterium]